jgi:hypothetical protein
MNEIQWPLVGTIFLGTVPMLGAILWNLVEVKSIRAELIAIRTEISGIKNVLAVFGERIATLEERDRWTHPLGPMSPLGPVVRK